MDDLKIKIIIHAINVFRKKGFKFTMSEVAADAGISKKTIYKVFESKEDLLLAIADYGNEKIQERKKEIISSNLETSQKIREVIIALPKDFIDLDFRKFDELAKTYPKVYERVAKHIEDDWEPIFELLEQGMREGKIRRINLQILREIISAAIKYYLASGELTRHGINYADALEETVSIIMDGILAKE
ncbi:MAG: hypothetical protein PWQ76_416 [Clostridiales bacterium]|jgi:AcrR family transcriptional regulator|nr:hypothetical protein [Clostridiales bacterium]